MSQGNLTDQPDPPFPCTEENIPKLKSWLTDSFSTSFFNISSAPMAKMSGPPMKIHVDFYTDRLAVGGGKKTYCDVVKMVMVVKDGEEESDSNPTLILHCGTANIFLKVFVAFGNLLKSYFVFW